MASSGILVADTCRKEKPGGEPVVDSMYYLYTPFATSALGLIQIAMSRRLILWPVNTDRGKGFVEYPEMHEIVTPLLRV